MMQIQGKYGIAEVFTDNIDSAAYSQILNTMCQCWARDVQVRIIPDVHACKDCTVGTTTTIKDKVVPNLVGVDIGYVECLSLRLRQSLLNLVNLIK